MEQSEGFKSVQQRIKILEETLSKCGELVQECEKSGEDTINEIEEQFAKCFNALAARKIVLLKEVQAKMTLHKQKIVESQAQLKTSIDACKQTLVASALIYPLNKDSAEGIFKEITKMSVPKISGTSVKFQFPASLLTNIQNYGDVDEVSCFLNTVDPKHFSKVDVVTTFAGSVSGGVDGNGIHAKFHYPWGICYNSLEECLYVCDHSNNSIRKLSMQGVVSTFVRGCGLTGPTGIVFNSKENTFFVANHTVHSISKITASGVVSIFAGSGKQGKADGNGTSASFTNPRGITIDPVTGVLYVCDNSNHSIRMISPQGEVSTLAGTGVAGYADGDKNKAQFKYPWGICFSEDDQSLLVCDYSNNKLRKVTLNGMVSTLCAVDVPIDVVITKAKSIIITSSTSKLFKFSLKDPPAHVAGFLAGSGIDGKEDGEALSICL